MENEKISFLVACDWFNDLQECTTEEKALILDYMFAYNLNKPLPETSDRFMKSMFSRMRQFFDLNNDKYIRACLLGGINQRIRWAREKEDPEEEKRIQEERDFLKTHTIQEYTSVYK